MIPAYNEEAALPATLAELSEIRPDLDVVVIGPGDLATSINKRGLPEDPEVLALMARAEAGILKSGVPIGGVARTAEQANAMIARGYVALALGFRLDKHQLAPDLIGQPLGIDRIAYGLAEGSQPIGL